MDGYLVDKAEYFVRELKKDIIDNELNESFNSLLSADVSSIQNNENYLQIVELYQELHKNKNSYFFESYIKNCVVDTVAMLLAGIDGSFDIGDIYDGLELKLDGEIISGCLRSEFNAVCEEDKK